MIFVIDNFPAMNVSFYHVKSFRLHIVHKLIQSLLLRMNSIVSSYSHV